MAEIIYSTPIANALIILESNALIILESAMMTGHGRNYL
jgi:hypothetical protein